MAKSTNLTLVGTDSGYLFGLFMLLIFFCDRHGIQIYTQPVA